MPVFTTAAVAIAAAVASTTAITVAAAVVATSIAVGVVGAALTVVGMITKNDTLMTVGKYMGYAGIAGGIAGLGMGALASSEAALGEMMAEGTTGSIAEAAAEGGLGEAGAVSSVAQGAVPGATGAVVPGAVVEGASEAQKAADMVGWMGRTDEAAAMPASLTPETAAGPAIAQQPAVGTPPPPTPGLVSAPAAPPAPGAPTTFTQAAGANLSSGLASTPGLSMTNPAYMAGVTPPPPGGIGPWWDSLDPNTKAHIALTAGQGLAGAAGGLFTGMSASDRLEFDQLINQQNRDLQQQQMARATSTPGIIRFAGQR